MSDASPPMVGDDGDCPPEGLDDDGPETLGRDGHRNSNLRKHLALKLKQTAHRRSTVLTVRRFRVRRALWAPREPFDMLASDLGQEANMRWFRLPQIGPGIPLDVSPVQSTEAASRD